MPESAKSELKTLQLEHYQCTFFFPLIPALWHETPPIPDAFAEYLYGSREDPDEAEAYHFFTPILRNTLFNRGGQPSTEVGPPVTSLPPMQEWRLPDSVIRQWRLTLKGIQPERGENEEEYVVPDKSVTVESVRLFRYFNGICLLAYTVKPAYGEGMELEDWLHFTRLGRQLYPTFTEQRDEKKLAPLVLRDMAQDSELARAFDCAMPLLLPPSDQPGAVISPVIQAILSAFYAPASQPVFSDWLQAKVALYDDRMFVSVAYGLPESFLVNKEGEVNKEEEVNLNRIHTLVAFTDRFADTGKNGYPYNHKVTEKFLQDKSFDLWADLGARYFYTEMVNAYVSGGCFFNNIVVAKHIPQIYDRMMVQALFYQASLRYYDQRITETTQKLWEGQGNVEEIRWQRSEFIRFTNQYWFPELTNQMQGKEIGRLQQQGLGLEEQYTRIQEEIQRTDEYLHAQREARSTDLGNQLTFWASVFAVLALYFATLPILNDMFKDFSLAKPPLSAWQSIEHVLTGIGIPAAWADVLVGGVFLLVVPFLLLMATILLLHSTED